MRKVIFYTFLVLSIFLSLNNQSYAKEQIATASWYRHSRLTANGEHYYPMGLTAAHKFLPFGSIIQFRNLNNNKVCVARINDRGPYIRGREFDVSEGCANLLDMKKKGVIQVAITIIRWGHKNV